MKKSNIIFLVIIMVLSLFTYIQERDLTKVKEENETLKSDLYDMENELVLVNSRLKDKEEELVMLKTHNELERETNNLIDAHVRSFFDAINTKDIDYLKNAVSSDVQVHSDGLIFANGYAFDLSEIKSDFDLEQRYYTLYENNLQFFTYYELTKDGEAYLYGYNFEFVNEDGKWKLNNLEIR